MVHWIEDASQDGVPAALLPGQVVRVASMGASNNVQRVLDSLAAVVETQLAAEAEAP